MGGRRHPKRVRSVGDWLELCLPLTKISEGFRADAYPDPATGGAPYTIGYGDTRGITPGMHWTKAHAERSLRERLKEFNAEVGDMVDVPLSPAQRAALVDFAYNLGAGALRDSTLLTKLNAGDVQGAANEFPRWKYAAGRVLPGLVTRRERERSLFLTGEWA